ncbi:ROK family protein [Microbacterium sp. DT81.1]|uniref:ROK family protein n=1 Tax=Microbacterium sp. DT81.1 TaxID=3393413 RepID=UPI003CEC06F5
MNACAIDDATRADGDVACSATARFLGVDIGGTAIKWSVLAGGAVEATGAIPTPRIDHHAVLAAVAELAQQTSGDLAGIGVAVPGTVNAVLRRSVFLPNLPGDWNDLPVADTLERLTGLPVVLTNDARAFAWAEHSTGAAVGIPDALFVTLGTGVGGAIALRGEILVGDMDAIGEMGHVPVDPRGVLCLCGGRGCLETIASASAIVGGLARTVAMSQSVMLRELTADGAQPLTAKIVADAARRGDPWAEDAFARAGAALGQAAATISLLLQLDAVVIGGGLLPAADLYLPHVQEALDARRSLTGRVSAISARYGHEAGSVGAAALAAHRVGRLLPSLTGRTQP